MKPKFFILIGLTACLIGCEHEREYPNMYFANETVIRGQLIYAVNPFDASDSVLCITDIIWLDIKTKDTCYLAYLDTLLFENADGRAHRHQSDNKVRYEQVPDSLVFHVVRDNRFMSVMNDTKRTVADSLVITYQYLYPPKETTSTCLVILASRPNDKQNPPIEDIYWGDYVSYKEKDYGQQPLVFDTISPSGEKILCVDGTYGPVFWATWEWINNE